MAEARDLRLPIGAAGITDWHLDDLHRRADRVHARGAFRCFMGSEIELLVAGNCNLRKEDQDLRLKLD